MDTLFQQQGLFSDEILRDLRSLFAKNFIKILLNGRQISLQNLI